MILRALTLAQYSRLVQLSSAPGTVREYYETVDAEAVRYPNPEPLEILGDAVQRVAVTTFKDFGDDLKAAVLNPRTVVSFAQHHAAIAHPLTMGAIAMESLYALISGTRQIDLTCGAVPLDNDTFPRGTLVSGTKLPFLTKKHRKMSVLTCPPVDPETFSAGLVGAAGTGAIDSETFDRVAGWWTSAIAEISELRFYWQQISVINQSIYDHGFLLGLAPPIMLPGEIIARDLLLLDHALERDSWLERGLYDPEVRSALIGSLNGIRCFWNVKTGRGTYLFWHVDQKARLQPVFPVGENLVTSDGLTTYRIHPEVISGALRDGTLIPASSCILIRIILQCGLRNFGGPLQYDYLANARKRILRDMRNVLTASEYSELSMVADPYYVDAAVHEGIPGGLECLTRPLAKPVLERFVAQEMSRLTSKSVNWVDQEVPDY
jgi:hypothetical protein